MNTPDSITVTLSRGRWSVSRSMDLDLALSTDGGEELFALFKEAHHAFTLAAQRLGPLWNNAPPTERIILDPKEIPISATFRCPDCKQAMSRTAVDSWCCYPCGVVWSFAKSTPVKQNPN